MGVQAGLANPVAERTLTSQPSRLREWRQNRRATLSHRRGSAGFVLLHFAGTIRSVLGTAETKVRVLHNSHASRSGALIAIAGMTTAIVMIAPATSEGAGGEPRRE
jgi:hypothetical protein